MMKSAGKVGLAVLISRILGLVRDQVFTFFFGAKALNDAFFMAFRIPNLLRDLFAEGALSSAFVTVFSRKKATEGDYGAWKLMRLVVTIQVAILSLIVVLGIIFAPEIVRVIAPDFIQEPGKTELTIILTRILFPFILFVGMAALSMGVLNAYGRFGLPASASSFFNLGSIILGVGLAVIFDPDFSDTAMICMAIGTVGGGILQWLVQVPALWKLGYRFRPEWNLKDPGLIEIGKLMGPAVVGVSAVQVNVLINSIFASSFPGAVTMLAVAFRLIQLPIGMFGVAISTASLPSMAVDAVIPDKNLFRTRVERALRLNTALCLPSACGLIILGTPIVGLLFQRGEFNKMNTVTTADLLSAYAIGLVAYASIKVLAPAFYAMNRTFIPMCVSLLSILVTLTLNWIFVKFTHFGAFGLALTTSISALFSASILLIMFTRAVGPFTRAIWSGAGKIIVASVAMSLVLISLQQVFPLSSRAHFLQNLTQVIVGVPVGGIVYFLIARLLKLEEVDEVLRMVGRKIGIRK
jgi:putative peptidoglycan lipid II flippase